MSEIKISTVLAWYAQDENEDPIQDIELSKSISTQKASNDIEDNIESFNALIRSLETKYKILIDLLKGDDDEFIYAIVDYDVPEKSQAEAVLSSVHSAITDWYEKN